MANSRGKHTKSTAMDQAEAELKEKQQRWDDKNKNDAKKEEERGKTEHQPPNISPMVPYTQEAYGGGLYGKDDEINKTTAGKLKGSDTQSADGPAQAAPPLKHQPPPSSGDRDIDITGQSYIQ